MLKKHLDQLTASRRMFTAALCVSNVAHLSARVPLYGLLDFAIGAPSQRLQELVAVLQVVLVMVFLHARVSSSITACRGLFGWSAGK